MTEEDFPRHWKTIHTDLIISEPDAGLTLVKCMQVSHTLQFNRAI